MTAEQRLAEVAKLLALGIQRLRIRERQTGDDRREFPWTVSATYAFMAPEIRTKEKAMNKSALPQLSALPGKSTQELKQLWRSLYGREPPPYNKPFLVKRLAFRIQELAYGGLSARAEAKLTQLVEKEDRRVRGKMPVCKGDRPVVGTQLLREWRGTEHVVTVCAWGYEYQGVKFKSLSAIARVITNTRWNGPAFFGLRANRAGK